MIQIQNKATTVTLQVDPAQATFVRDGNDLVIKALPAGETQTVIGFFAVGDNNPLPDFVLPDGAVVTGKDFLAAQNPDLDLSTAAGPAAVTGGAGEYIDNQGALLGGLAGAGMLGGVDKTGTLGTNQWDNNPGQVSATNTANATVNTVTTANTIATAGSAVDKGTTSSGPATVSYNSRAVIYAHDEQNNARNNTTYAVEIPSVSSKSSIFISAQNAEYFTITPTTQSTTINLTEAGYNALLALNGKDMYVYFTFTAEDGKVHKVQLIVTKNYFFDSTVVNSLPASETGGVLAGSLIHGEWHGGKNLGTAVNGGNITTSDLGDSVTFSTVTKSLISTGKGEDTLKITKDVTESIIDAGKGNDTITIDGALRGGSAIMASGRIVGEYDSNTITVSGGMVAKAKETNSIHTHDGSITIGKEGMVAEGGVNAIYAEAATVTIAGAGNAMRADSGARNSIHTAGKVSLSVEVTPLQSGIAMSAKGDGSRNEITRAGDVTIAAATTGLYASAGGHNSVTSDGTVGITVQNGVGVEAAGVGSRNTIVPATSVSMTATTGVQATEGATNLIDAKENVSIAATTGQALNAQSGGVNIVSVQGNINLISNSNAAVYAANTEAKSIKESVNTIESMGGIRIQGNTAGVSAAGNGQNTVSAVGSVVVVATDGSAMNAVGGGLNTLTSTKDIVLDGKIGMNALQKGGNNVTSTGAVTLNNEQAAMSTSDGTNRIATLGDVTLNSQGAAMSSVLAGKNTITAEGKVSLHAESGMSAQGANSINEISSTKNVDINVTNNLFSGMYASGAGANNTINKAANVSIVAATGIESLDRGSNKIIADGDVSVKSFEREGLWAQSAGINTIDAGGKISIDSKTIGLGASGGFNTLISAKSIDITGSIGVFSGSDGANSIAAKEEVSVKVNGTALQTQGANAANLIAAQKVTLAGEIGMNAHTAGMNVVEAKTVSITADSTTGDALGMYAETGENTIKALNKASITINATSSAKGAFGVYGGENSIVGSNEGDEIAIKALSTAGEAKGVFNGHIEGNAGSDTITIEALSKTASAYAIDGATINLGASTDNDGGNTLSIRATVDSQNSVAVAYGAHNSTISGSAGNDFISIDSTASKGSAYGVLGGDKDTHGISLHNGENNLEVHSTSTQGNAYGVRSAFIEGGTDNDRIDISATSANNASFALRDSRVSTGDGNDMLSIRAQSGQGYNAYAVHESTVNMGSGNDSLSISGGTLSFKSAPFLFGGAGEDTINLDGFWASPGVQDHSFKLSQVGSILEGFEVLDMHGSTKNTLTIDSLLASATGLQDNNQLSVNDQAMRSALTDEAAKVLRVQGDGTDTVTLGTGWHDTQITATYNGVGYTVYRNNATGAENEMLLVQQGVFIA